LFNHADIDTVMSTEVRRRVGEALTRVDPGVVLIPGWSHRGALIALEWSLRLARPAILMSASTVYDRARRRSGETIKRRLIRLYSAALVGGIPQREYVRTLGLPYEFICDGYDCVDNQHFAAGARAARADADSLRRQLCLPRRFFLASSRFVEEKNLLRMLEAYAAYRRLTDSQPWDFVLLGEGPLRESIARHISRLNLAGNVLLPGFKQYDQLPAYYGLAGAFVLASTSEPWGLVVNEAMAGGLPVLVSKRCGCAPDLVKEGANGYIFDPYSVAELAGLMQRIAALNDEQRHAMGRAAQDIIGHWGPERFAHGLMQAVGVAMSRPSPKASWMDRVLLWALISRRT
jgi:glycosyltransferase involved in cell wall biosynthesis